MKYDEFLPVIVKDNRRLKIHQGLSTIIFAACLIFILAQRRYFIYAGGEIFKENLTVVDICRESFGRVLHKTQHSYFVSDGIMEILKKEPFAVEDGEIQKLWPLDDKRCQAIVKEKNTLRSFTLTLDSGPSYPFFYKLAQVDEKEITGDEL
ncbi:MAG: hypothetical protein WCG27_11150 [Pseudomonadota bacterium]